MKYDRRTGHVVSVVSKKQHEAVRYANDDTTEQLLFGGGAGGGKSFIVLSIAVAMAYKYPGIRIFVGRNQLNDLIKGCIPTISKITKSIGFAFSKAWNHNQNSNVLTCKSTGSTITLGELKYRASDPEWDRIGSLEFTIAIIEECQEVEEKIVDILLGRVGRHLNKEYGIKPLIMMTCNPTKLWPYDTWYDPWKRGELPAYMKFVRATAYDNPFLPASYLRSLGRIKDEQTRQRLLDGEWEYAVATRQIIDEEWVTEAYRVKGVDGPARMGVDPAGEGYGVDDNCIVVVIGNTVERVIRCRYVDVSDATAEEQFADMVIEMAQKYSVEPSEIRIDTQGDGASLSSILRSKGWVCRNVYSQGHAIPRKGSPLKLHNIRSQGLYELGQKLRSGKIRIRHRDAKLKKALASYWQSEYEKAWAAEDKRITRRRLGRSPDDGDAMWMALFDFQKKGGRAISRRTERKRPEA